MRLYYVAISFSLLLSACATPFSSTKPKKPNPKDVGVEVVDKVPVKETQIEPIQDAGVVTSEPKKHLSQAEKYLKTPEPFSLKSNEEDPELLGPQTTLKNPLLKKETLENNSSSSLESNHTTRKKEQL